VPNAPAHAVAAAIAYVHDGGARARSSLLAVVLVARRRRYAARVAVVVAWIEIAAFTFFHGIPVEIGPSKPYWGDGSGDALQWVGLLSIMACSAAIVLVAGRRPSQEAATTAAAKVPADPNSMSHRAGDASIFN